MVPYTSGAAFEGKDRGERPQNRPCWSCPNGVTLKGDGVRSRGQEPRTQASIYSVTAAEL